MIAEDFNQGTENSDKFLTFFVASPSLMIVVVGQGLDSRCVKTHFLYKFCLTLKLMIVRISVIQRLSSSGPYVPDILCVVILIIKLFCVDTLVQDCKELQSS